MSGNVLHQNYFFKEYSQHVASIFFTNTEKVSCDMLVCFKCPYYNTLCVGLGGRGSECKLHHAMEMPARRGLRAVFRTVWGFDRTSRTVELSFNKSMRLNLVSKFRVFEVWIIVCFISGAIVDIEDSFKRLGWRLCCLNGCEKFTLAVDLALDRFVFITRRRVKIIEMFFNNSSLVTVLWFEYWTKW